MAPYFMLTTIVKGKLGWRRRSSLPSNEDHSQNRVHFQLRPQRCCGSVVSICLACRRFWVESQHLHLKRFWQQAIWKTSACDPGEIAPIWGGHTALDGSWIMHLCMSSSHPVIISVAWQWLSGLPQHQPPYLQTKNCPGTKLWIQINDSQSKRSREAQYTSGYWKKGRPHDTDNLPEWLKSNSNANPFPELLYKQPICH